MAEKNNRSRMPKDSFFFEKVVPASLVVMGIVTLGLIVFAAGVLFGYGQILVQENPMSINHILPFASTLIMLVFTVTVLQRYFVRRQAHFLFWGIGLAMFGVGSFAEAYLALEWNKRVFFGC